MCEVKNWPGLFTILPQSAALAKANYCLERGIMQHSKDKFKVGYLLDPNLNQVGSYYVCILIFLHPRVCIKQNHIPVIDRATLRQWSYITGIWDLYSKWSCTILYMMIRQFLSNDISVILFDTCSMIQDRLHKPCKKGRMNSKAANAK